MLRTAKVQAESTGKEVEMPKRGKNYLHTTWETYARDRESVLIKVKFDRKVAFRVYD